MFDWLREINDQAIGLVRFSGRVQKSVQFLQDQHEAQTSEY
ncbi:MAG: hypothetical protein ACKVII_13795 [Planctomycetales bacterium]|jgi:hypothetical protein